MQTVKDVMKLVKSKNRAERMQAAKQFPAMVTASQEEIYEAMIALVSAEDLETALEAPEEASGEMTDEMHEALKAMMNKHHELPSGSAAKVVKTVKIGEDGKPKRLPGRPTAEAERVFRELQEAQAASATSEEEDGSEREKAFELVNSYVTSKDDEDDDEDVIHHR